ncbi:hypothetical protein K1719_009669 [Acacia pycnantha]|nr:hypothetical protein K1719_009669 [Acacia pycnantha]
MDDDVIPIVQQLRRKLSQETFTGQGQGEEEETRTQEIRKEFPFEFRALEVALEAICSFLDARVRELETDTHPALNKLTSKISIRNLDKVRKLKSAMNQLTNRVRKIRDELEHLK